MPIQNDIYAIGMTRLIVGTSLCQQINPVAGQVRVDISLGIAGGTLFLSGATTTSTGVSFGLPFAGTAAAQFPTVSLYGAPTNAFLHAAGATCNVSIAYYLTTPI